MKKDLDIHIIFNDEVAQYIRLRSKQHGITMAGFVKMMVMHSMQQDKDYIESNKYRSQQTTNIYFHYSNKYKRRSILLFTRRFFINRVIKSFSRSVFPKHTK